MGSPSGLPSCDVPQPHGPVEARGCERLPSGLNERPQTSFVWPTRGSPSVVRGSSCPRAAACRRSRPRRAFGRRSCTRSSERRPRRHAGSPSLPSAVRASSASTIALDASAVGFSRSASSPRSSDCSTWSSTCARRRRGERERASRIGWRSGLRFAAPAPRCPARRRLRRATRGSPPTRTNRRTVARRRSSCSYSRRQSRIGSARTSWKSS